VVENLADIAPHAFADVLPWMSETELSELTGAIGARGQIEPVVTWIDETGKEWLLDGRHRAEAARRLGRSLSVRRFDGSESEAQSLVFSLNVHRRHLTPSQRALAAGALATRAPRRPAQGSK
jgi:ParB-like chromosome segregation protein Spo0J